MRKYFSIPLLFFFLAALLGLFLRWQFIAPTPGIRFAWFVHAHSHVMFLGWVTNVLFLAFISRYLQEKDHRSFLRFFVALQVLVVAMMISFPIQGYGMYSIIFTTLHTLAMMVFVIVFFRRTAGQQSVSLWYARAAWLFFFISTAGPFSLGYLMANGLGDTVWSDFSIYFYLHFQYNGFFIFGIFSLFLQQLEQKQIPFNAKRIRTIGTLMAVACLPAYALSTLFAHPGLLFNIVGALAAVLQLYALVLLRRELKAINKDLRLRFRKPVYWLMGATLVALVVKSVLQLLSAHPALAQMAYELRPVVIAYLHLVLVGIITLFLLAWYMEMKFVRQSLATFSVIILFIGFVTSELFMVALPWWPSRMEGLSAVMSIFIVSVLMVLGTFLFYMSFLLKQPGSASARQT